MREEKESNGRENEVKLRVGEAAETQSSGPRRQRNQHSGRRE